MNGNYATTNEELNHFKDICIIFQADANITYVYFLKSSSFSLRKNRPDKGPYNMFKNRLDKC